jgi:DNA helicase-2/ATP-dependent DNA helicase PcrA
MHLVVEHINSKLNLEQKSATIYTDGSSLVIAWAGSWKTRVLTYKIAYLIYEKNINPLNILAVTFTNKSANEMKERLIVMSKELNIWWNSVNSHIWSYQFKWIGTFHSIFLKILKEDIDQLETKLNRNFGIYDDGEATSIIKQILKELNMIEKIEIKEVKYMISKLKNEGITPKKYKSLIKDNNEEIIADIYEKYQKTLQSTNSMDFDDLLLYPYELFKKHPDVLHKRIKQFKYILVDEAQDTNYIQFELMKMLAWTDGNITFIGDDFQSIYRRRGALMENFLNLNKIRPNIRIFKLQTNYRSKPHIIQAGNHIIANNTRQYHKNIVPYREGNEKVMILSHRNDTEEAINIVSLIKSLKQKKGFWSDHTILYRTNAQSQPFEHILVTEGIPYKIQWGHKFFDRKEIKDILAYIKYLTNPEDIISLKRIINIPARKIWATTINKLEQYANTSNITLHQVLFSINELPLWLNSSTLKSINDFIRLIKWFNDYIDSMSPMMLIKKVINDIKYEQYLIHSVSKTEAEEKMQNLGQLINMANKYE